MARTKTPEDAERDFRRAARFIFRNPKGATITTDRVQLSNPQRELPITKITCGKVDESAAILYLHGGGYVAGSAWAHRGMLAYLSRLVAVPVFAPDYRLAQNAPFPAAFEDTVAAWTTVRAKQKLRPEQILIAGDSAGGGLALALLAHLLEIGERPAGLIGFSPWTDLTLSSESLATNEHSDAILIRERMPELCDIILHGADPTDPRVSPLFANWKNPPPVYLQASATEILLDDARRMIERLKDAGGQATLDVWPDAPHVWQIFEGWIPEAQDALEKAALFARKQLNSHSPDEN